MMPVAGSRLDSRPAGVCSAQSTSMSLQCDSPLASAYRLWIRMLELLSLVTTCGSGAGRRGEHRRAQALRQGFQLVEDGAGDGDAFPVPPLERATAPLAGHEDL